MLALLLETVRTRPVQILLIALAFSSCKSGENDFYLINLLPWCFAYCGVGHGGKKMKGYLTLGLISVHVIQCCGVGWGIVQHGGS